MRIRELQEFLGLRRSLAGLLSMCILVGMGEKMAERFLPIYLIALGAGPLAIGLLNGLDNLLSALYSLPGGLLSDRFGHKKALLMFNLLAMVGFAIVILIPRWEAVLAGAVFFLSWTAISLPATMSLVSTLLPKNKRTMGVSMHSLVRRIPMGLGPVLGGLFIDIWGRTSGVRLAFILAFVMAGLAIWIQQIFLREDVPAKRESPDDSQKSPCLLMAQMGPALKNLLISDILIRFCEQIPYAFVVVWCMESIQHPVTASQFGFLTAIEMATAILIYIPVAYLADRSTKKPFVVATFVFFTLFPLILLWCHSFTSLVFAFVLRGLKEFGEPTRKALIMDLAPEGAKARMFGLYYMIRDVVVSVAAFGGAFLWMRNPATNLLAAFGFGVLGTLWFLWKGEDTGKVVAQTA